ncbi:MAG: glycoside hydrolase family 3 N-terminal domain-containing protein [Ferruginibacter sp.]
MKFTGWVCLLVIVLNVPVNKTFCQSLNAVQPPALPYKNRLLPVNERVLDLLSRMTNTEKIKQLDMYRGWDISPMGQAHEASLYDAKLIAKTLGSYSVGSIHDFYPLYASLPNRVQQYIMDNSRLGIPVMFIEEGLHGYSGKGSTSFPIPLALAATWDTSLIYKVGRSIATETRANGTHMILGPLLDIARDPRWGRMEETYGEDTYLVSEIGLSMVKGLQGGDISRPDAVISEPKHFAVHGIPEAGSNTTPVNIGVREIRSSYLPAFEKAVKKGGAFGIMAAYHEIDGLPMVDNKWLLTDVLRKEWGFNGFVLSDLGAIKLSLENHQVAKSPSDALAQTFNAGMNMQFYDFDHGIFEKAIDSALKNKAITQARLDSTVADVLRVKFLLGLFDKPYIDTTLWAKVKNCKAHQETALKAAQQSICLLKNDKNVLPLTNISSLAVIGPMAQSNYLGGYSNTEDTAVSLLTGLRERAGKNILINYAAGISKTDSVLAINNAVELVKRSDVAVVALGEDLQEIGEGKDRASLQLSAAQLDLVKAIQQTGKPVVVVLMNGRALCINWVAENATAIVEGWFNGEKSGLAMADVLLGNINPSGKLPVTFPRSIGQIPFYYSHKPTSYHRYVDEKDTPLYAFGHGLSYTTFMYSNLQLPSVPVSVPGDVEIKMDIVNTGKLYGEEVVQLYIRDVVSSVTTPDKALKAFTRVGLKPGESKTVSFKLNVKEALSLWNRDMQQVVEPGQFRIMIGSASNDIRLSGMVEVK